MPGRHEAKGGVRTRVELITVLPLEFLSLESPPSKLSGPSALSLLLSIVVVVESD